MADYIHTHPYSVPHRLWGSMADQLCVTAAVIAHQVDVRRDESTLKFVGARQSTVIGRLPIAGTGDV